MVIWVNTLLSSHFISFTLTEFPVRPQSAADYSLSGCFFADALKIPDCEANLLFPGLLLPPSVLRTLSIPWLLVLPVLSARSGRRLTRQHAGNIFRQRRRAILPAAAIKVGDWIGAKIPVNQRKSCVKLKCRWWIQRAASWLSVLPQHVAVQVW